MKPFNSSGHVAYHERILTQIRKYYPNAIDSLLSSGTFYALQSRLWNSDNKNLSNPIHPLKEKPKKPAVNGEKALPVEKVTVKVLFEQFQSSPPEDMNTCTYLFQIFNKLFLQHSNELGLLDLMHLSLANMIF